VYQIKPIKT